MKSSACTGDLAKLRDEVSKLSANAVKSSACTGDLAKLRDEVSSLAKDMGRLSESVHSISASQALQLEAMQQQQQQRDQNPQVGPVVPQTQSQDGSKTSKKKKKGKGSEAAASVDASDDSLFDLLDKPVSMKQHHEDCSKIRQVLLEEAEKTRMAMKRDMTLFQKEEASHRETICRELQDLRVTSALSAERNTTGVSLQTQNSVNLANMAGRIGAELADMRERAEQVERNAKGFMDSAIDRFESLARDFRSFPSSLRMTGAADAMVLPESDMERIGARMQDMQEEINKIVLKMDSLKQWTQSVSTEVQNTNNVVKASLFTLTFRLNVITMSILLNEEILKKSFIPELKAQVNDIRNATEFLCDKTSGFMSTFLTESATKGVNAYGIFPEKTD